MKLYWMTDSCALAAHIVALEGGIPIELMEVDRQSKRTSDGSDFLAINPKGYVPALTLESGEVLTEGTVIVQYLADLKPEASLAPPNGTFARVRLQETLSHITTEIHRGYSPLFNRSLPLEIRKERTAVLHRQYGVLEKRLAAHGYLMGDAYSVADAYLFALTRWAPLIRLDLDDLPNIQALQKKIAARPAVRSAMMAQGLPTDS